MQARTGNVRTVWPSENRRQSMVWGSRTMNEDMEVGAEPCIQRL